MSEQPPESWQQPRAIAIASLLPNEILEHIFLMVHKEHDAHSALDLQAFRWVAGQVCSRWREIILFLSPLWKDFSLDMRKSWKDGSQCLMFRDGDAESKELPRRPADILQEHLRRSRNCPLSVNLNYSSESDEYLENPASDLFAVIGAHSEQWKDARLAVHSPYMAQLLFDQVNGRLPHLERLRWHPFPNPLPDAILAPNLCDLDILSNILLTTAFPLWLQLKRITINSIQRDNILTELRILQSSQQLEEIHFQGRWFNNMPPELNFDHLRCLTCAASGLDLFLNLPALEVLNLTSDTNLSALPAFIQRTAPGLSSLTLPNLLRPESCLIIIDVLEMLPGLKILSVDPRKTLDQASLPNLQHLAIRINTGESVAFIEMIQSRISDQYEFPRLRSAELIKGREQIPEGYLEELMQKGLRVTFSP
ncbi:hypothetical protein C8J56DRAFT_963411 [Mycena floridula]|nr:hypothetical protein C8J56DRAFT_963411 [Mycena floridula]